MEGQRLTIDEIDKHISHSQDSLSTLPRSSRKRASLLVLLAKQRLDRFHLSVDGRDIEMSILHLTHSIFLPFRPPTEDSPNTILALFFLAEALFFRSRKYKQPADIRYCIKCLHFLRNRDASHKAFGVTRNLVTTSLVYALGLQVNLEPRNAVQRVEEMSVLCSELLCSDLSNASLKSAISSFSGAVRDGLIVPSIPPSQQVIECLREVNVRFPDLQTVSFRLSLSLFNRLFETHSINDYEDAMATLDKIVSPYPPTDKPNPHLGQALELAARLARARFCFYGNPEYLEEAIFHWRAYLNSTSLEDPDRNEIAQSLEELEGRRFEGLGGTNRLPSPRSSNLEATNLPSFSDLSASLTKLNPLHDRLRLLNAVGTMDLITDKADIEEAVKSCRLLLISLQQCPDGEKTSLTYLTITMLGDFLFRVFSLTENPEYLNESIDAYRGILKVPHAQWIHFSVIIRLITALLARFMLSYDSRDFGETMQLSSIAAANTYANVPSRVDVSWQWAQSARASGHSSTSAAYDSATSLMQDSLAFSPTLETQHFRLVTMPNNIEELPLDYASYLAHMGQLKEAITTLEQGRGLLWSELRGMRTSIDQLCAADSCLAEKFANVNRDLETLTTSGSQDFLSNDRDIDHGEMHSFGNTVLKQRKLLDERKSLIMQIRSLPGFGNFLTAPSFDTLRSAAVHGPVIIINHCRWRSDIIILLHNTPPSLIPTPNDFYDRAKALKEQLLVGRKKGLDSMEYDDALSSVLKTLCDLVGRPVIQKLQELNIPEQSRIWWCPTSVFCSLPLHAMGPVRSEGPFKLYFSDLYIPSYTPTLSALIGSRKPGPHLFEKPSILLVAQPDKYMPAALKEIDLIRRLNTSVTSLTSKKATPSAVMDRLQDHRFAHFSCHGILETGKPFDAAFKLYGGERLTLLDIIRSRLPSAEFAFLSACHTAELTEQSIADEGLHLAAAVQYSGFRSVVGTMWAMADIDGQVLAKHFYGSLFSDRWQGMPYYERTAEALRDAVKELRSKKNVTLERWVNFVHYGA